MVQTFKCKRVNFEENSLQATFFELFMIIVIHLTFDNLMMNYIFKCGSGGFGPYGCNYQNQGDAWSCYQLSMVLVIGVHKSIHIQFAMVRPPANIMDVQENEIKGCRIILLYLLINYIQINQSLGWLGMKLQTYFWKWMGLVNNTNHFVTFMTFLFTSIWHLTF